MNAAFAFLIALAIGATLVVLLVGVFNMFRSNHDPHTSNKLMRWRIILQAIAIAMILVVLWLNGH